jgi:hypothetical protein
MVTLEQAKELLAEYNLADEQVEEIRDAFKKMAEIIYEKWASDTHLTKQTYEFNTEQENT